MPKTPGTQSPPQKEPSPLEQFEATFLSSYDGFWICDGNGVVLRVNPASERINGIQSGDIVGQHVSRLQEWGLVDRCVTM
jgi:PAS domain S-box-containing protein